MTALAPGDRVRLVRRIGFHDAGAVGIVVALPASQLHGYELAVEFARTAVLCLNRNEVETVGAA